MSAFGPVTMVTTADPVMARVFRMTAMSVATSAGLQIDRVEDLALAVSEAFAVSIDGRPNGGSLACEIDGEPGVVRIRMAPAEGAGMAPGTVGIHPLAERVLTTVTDEFTHEAATGVIRFRVANSSTRG